MALIPLDDFGKLAVSRYEAAVAEYNKEVSKLKSVESIEDFTQSFAETWEGVADLNANIEKLNQALEALLAERIAKITPVVVEEYKKAVESTGVNTTALDEQLKFIRSTMKYLSGIYQAEDLESLPKPEARSKGGNTAGNSGATGGKRIRGFDVRVNGVLAQMKNAQGVMKSTFTAAAKVIGCQVSELQEAFFSAAGMEDTSNDEFPALVEFQYKDHNVRVSKVGDSSEEEAIEATTA